MGGIATDGSCHDRFRSGIAPRSRAPSGPGRRTSPGTSGKSLFSSAFPGENLIMEGDALLGSRRPEG